MSTTTDAVVARGVTLRLRRHLQAELFLLCCMLALLLRGFSFHTDGLDWDESLYIVMAQRWLQGGLPYVAVWDQHPIGVPALFAAGQWLIEDGLLVARLTALFAVTGTAFLLMLALDRLMDRRLAGILAALIYLLVMSRPDGLAANTEVFNNFLVTAAAVLLLRETLREHGPMRAGPWFAAALLFGAGLQVKYVVFPEAVLLCSAALLHAWFAGEKLGRLAGIAALAVLGGLLPTALASLYFWQAGAWQAYLDANLRANLAYLDLPVTLATTLAQLRYGLLPIVTLVLWPFLLVPLLRRQAGDRRIAQFGWWLAVWLAAAAIDVALPMKFWKHYFNALLPPLSLAAGLGCVLLAQCVARRTKPLLAVALVVTVAPALALMVKHAPHSYAFMRTNVPHEIATRIRQQGSNGRDVYVLNYDPLIYADAHVLPPTPYVLGIELADFAGSSGGGGPPLVDREWAEAPNWIIVAQPSPYEYPASVWQRLDATLRDYELDSTWYEDDYVQRQPFVVRLYHRTG